MRNLFRRHLPDHKTLKEHKQLKVFGRLILNPNLWHLNRHSVATAFTVGLICAFIPMPFQMVIAAAGAILVRANLPISVAMVWLTNPLTMGPIFYFTYKLGSWILGQKPITINFEITYEWLANSMKTVGPAFLLGSIVTGVTLGILSNILVRLIWRVSILIQWKARQRKRQKPE